MKPTVMLLFLGLIATAPAPRAAGTSEEERRDEAPDGSAAVAPADDEAVAALGREVATLRERVRLLQDRIAALSAALARAAPPPRAAAPGPAASPSVAGRPAPVVPGRPGTTVSRVPSLLNPAISAVFELTGVTSVERGSDPNSFDLSEAEIALQSMVDPFTRVDLFLSFPADEAPEVEEGIVSTTNLRGPFQIKGGRYKNAFGKWNLLHSHAFPTVDLPDALEIFFGEESLTQDGLSLSVLIPNPWELYIESLTEIGMATEGPSFNSGERNLSYLEHLAAFFDTTPNSTLEAGLSAAFGHTGPSALLLDEIESRGLAGTLAPDPVLDSSVLGLDLTFKWRPVGFKVYRSFMWQAEVLRSRRNVQVLSRAMSLAPETVSTLGGYSYVEWQFARRWRVGARYDLSEFPDTGRGREWAASGLVRFQPSEWQELRLQVKHTRRDRDAALRFDGESDATQVFFEWVPVIGAHGAHKY
ncbi:MAG: hypothetical protein ACE5JH_06710 [Acidobacteriota bacterium]